MRAFNIYKKGTGDILGTVLENGIIDAEYFKPFGLLISQIKRGVNNGKEIVIVESKRTKKGGLSGSSKLTLSISELAVILNNTSIKIRRRKPLSTSDREYILDLKERGFGYSEIAMKTNRSKSVISRALNH